MTGIRKEEAIALEQQGRAWTCECGQVNEMGSYHYVHGGESSCINPKCNLITVL